MKVKFLIILLALIVNTTSYEQIPELGIQKFPDYINKKYSTKFCFSQSNLVKDIQTGDLFGISTNILNLNSMVDGCELEMVLDYNFDKIIKIPSKLAVNKEKNFNSYCLYTSLKNLSNYIVKDKTCFFCLRFDFKSNFSMRFIHDLNLFAEKVQYVHEGVSNFDYSKDLVVHSNFIFNIPITTGLNLYTIPEIFPEILKIENINFGNSSYNIGDQIEPDILVKFDLNKNDDGFSNFSFRQLYLNDEMDIIVNVQTNILEFTELSEIDSNFKYYLLENRPLTTSKILRDSNFVSIQVIHYSLISGNKVHVDYSKEQLENMEQQNDSNSSKDNNTLNIKIGKYKAVKTNSEANKTPFIIELLVILKNSGIVVSKHLYETATDQITIDLLQLNTFSIRHINNWPIYDNMNWNIEFTLEFNKELSEAIIFLDHENFQKDQILHFMTSTCDFSNTSVNDLDYIDHIGFRPLCYNRHTDFDKLTTPVQFEVTTGPKFDNEVNLKLSKPGLFFHVKLLKEAKPINFNVFINFQICGSTASTAEETHKYKPIFSIKVMKKNSKGEFYNILSPVETPLSTECHHVEPNMPSAQTYLDLMDKSQSQCTNLNKINSATCKHYAVYNEHHDIILGKRSKVHDVDEEIKFENGFLTKNDLLFDEAIKNKKNNYLLEEKQDEVLNSLYKLQDEYLSSSIKNGYFFKQSKSLENNTNTIFSMGVNLKSKISTTGFGYSFAGPWGKPSDANNVLTAYINAYIIFYFPNTYLKQIFDIKQNCEIYFTQNNFITGVDNLQSRKSGKCNLKPEVENYNTCNVLEKTGSGIKGLEKSVDYIIKSAGFLDYNTNGVADKLSFLHGLVNQVPSVNGIRQNIIENSGVDISINSDCFSYKNFEEVNKKKTLFSHFEFMLNFEPNKLNSKVLRINRFIRLLPELGSIFYGESSTSFNLELENPQYVKKESFGKIYGYQGNIGIIEIEANLSNATTLLLFLHNVKFFEHEDPYYPIRDHLYDNEYIIVPEYSGRKSYNFQNVIYSDNFVNENFEEISIFGVKIQKGNFNQYLASYLLIQPFNEISTFYFPIVLDENRTIGISMISGFENKNQFNLSKQFYINKNLPAKLFESFTPIPKAGVFTPLKIDFNYNKIFFESTNLIDIKAGVFFYRKENFNQIISKFTLNDLNLVYYNFTSKSYFKFFNQSFNSGWIAINKENNLEASKIEFKTNLPNIGYQDNFLNNICWFNIIDTSVANSNYYTNMKIDGNGNGNAINEHLNSLISMEYYDEEKLNSKATTKEVIFFNVKVINQGLNKETKCIELKVNLYPFVRNTLFSFRFLYIEKQDLLEYSLITKKTIAKSEIFDSYINIEDQIIFHSNDYFSEKLNLYKFEFCNIRIEKKIKIMISEYLSTKEIGSDIKNYFTSLIPHYSSIVTFPSTTGWFDYNILTYSTLYITPDNYSDELQKLVSLKEFKYLRTNYLGSIGNIILAVDVFEIIPGLTVKISGNFMKLKINGEKGSYGCYLEEFSLAICSVYLNDANYDKSYIKINFPAILTMSSSMISIVLSPVRVVDSIGDLSIQLSVYKELSNYSLDLIQPEDLISKREQIMTNLSIQKGETPLLKSKVCTFKWYDSTTKFDSKDFNSMKMLGFENKLYLEIDNNLLRSEITSDKTYLLTQKLSKVSFFFSNEQSDLFFYTDEIEKEFKNVVQCKNLNTGKFISCALDKYMIFTIELSNINFQVKDKAEDLSKPIQILLLFDNFSPNFYQKLVSKVYCALENNIQSVVISEVVFDESLNLNSASTNNLGLIPGATDYSFSENFYLKVFVLNDFVQEQNLTTSNVFNLKLKIELDYIWGRNLLEKDRRKNSIILKEKTLIKVNFPKRLFPFIINDDNITVSLDMYKDVNDPEKGGLQGEFWFNFHFNNFLSKLINQKTLDDNYLEKTRTGLKISKLKTLGNTLEFLVEEAIEIDYLFSFFELQIYDISTPVEENFFGDVQILIMSQNEPIYLRTFNSDTYSTPSKNPLNKFDFKGLYQLNKSIYLQRSNKAYFTLKKNFSIKPGSYSKLNISFINNKIYDNFKNEFLYIYLNNESKLKMREKEYLLHPVFQPKKNIFIGIDCYSSPAYYFVQLKVNKKKIIDNTEKTKTYELIKENDLPFEQPPILLVKILERQHKNKIILSFKNTSQVFSSNINFEGFTKIFFSLDNSNFSDINISLSSSVSITKSHSLGITNIIIPKKSWSFGEYYNNNYFIELTSTEETSVKLNSSSECYTLDYNEIKLIPSKIFEEDLFESFPFTDVFKYYNTEIYENMTEKEKYWKKILNKNQLSITFNEDEFYQVPSSSNLFCVLFDASVHKTPTFEEVENYFSKLNLLNNLKSPFYYPFGDLTYRNNITIYENQGQVNENNQELTNTGNEISDMTEEINKHINEKFYFTESIRSKLDKIEFISLSLYRGALYNLKCFIQSSKKHLIKDILFETDEKLKEKVSINNYAYKENPLNIVKRKVNNGLLVEEPVQLQCVNIEINKAINQKLLESTYLEYQKNLLIQTLYEKENISEDSYSSNFDSEFYESPFPLGCLVISDNLGNVPFDFNEFEFTKTSEYYSSNKIFSDSMIELSFEDRKIFNITKTFKAKTLQRNKVFQEYTLQICVDSILKCPTNYKKNDLSIKQTLDEFLKNLVSNGSKSNKSLNSYTSYIADNNNLISIEKDLNFIESEIKENIMFVNNYSNFDFYCNWLLQKQSEDLDTYSIIKPYVNLTNFTYNELIAYQENKNKIETFIEGYNYTNTKYYRDEKFVLKHNQIEECIVANKSNCGSYFVKNFVISFNVSLSNLTSNGNYDLNIYCYDNLGRFKTQVKNAFTTNINKTYVNTTNLNNNTVNATSKNSSSVDTNNSSISTNANSNLEISLIFLMVLQVLLLN